MTRTILLTALVAVVSYLLGCFSTGITLSRAKGVDIRTETPAVALIMEDGKCVGVRAVDSNGEEIECRAKAVVVATGGFGTNKEMIKNEFGLDLWENFFPFNVPGTAGDGLNMMWEAGAQKFGANIEMIFQMKDNMSHFMLDACFRQPALLVNQKGVRFMDEGQMGNTTFTGNAINLFRNFPTGENAKSAWISGEQVFKYAAGSTTSTPAQITLTANLQNVTMGKWQYKNSSGSWTDYPTTSANASITGTTLVVKPSHAIWVGDAATIRITTSDDNIGDTTSIYKVTDGADGNTGAAGKNASVVFLSNENVTFAANASGQVSATSVTCNVVSYTGTTKVTPTVGMPCLAAPSTS